MTPRMTLAALCTALLALASGAQAQQHDPATPIAVASKVALRGEANNIAVREMRLVRKNDILTVQADLQNVTKKDVVAYHRFRWLDASGNQVGDGESWKQTPVYGEQITTIKSVAPTSAVVDLRLEMNVEKK